MTELWSFGAGGAAGAAMRLMRFVCAACLAVATATAQPANQPAHASMTWNGVDGPPWPITVNAAPPAPAPFLQLQIGGFPQQGFVLVVAPAGVTTTGIPTAFGLVDLDVSEGITFLLDGLFGYTQTGFETAAWTGPTGAVNWFIPFAAGPGWQIGGIQALVADPTVAAGASLSAATDLGVHPGPGTAIHVAPGGAPGNPGTPSAPAGTISAGIALALAAGPVPAPLRVAAGTYQESPVFPQFLDVEGGLDPLTWTPVPGQRSVVLVGTTPARAEDILVPTRLARLDFRAAPAAAPGAASIAFVVARTTPLLVFEDCRFEADAGMAGAAGAPGTFGSPGSPGENSVIQYANPWFPLPYVSAAGGAGARPGGDGGHGLIGTVILGTYYIYPAENGGNAPFGGGAGGLGVQWCSTIWEPLGGNGSGGSPGVAGTSAAVSVAGHFGTSGWDPGAGDGGTTGTPGLGGGGGGGGGVFVGLSSPGCVGGGGHGGGGGAGGEGGSGGAGGSGGGASLGVVIDAARAVFRNCSFASGAGGQGGNGGGGGTGGAGGSGGTGSYNGPVSGIGGSGGAGGNGGAGGGGAGGPGGPSFGIWRVGFGDPLLADPTFTVGAGGSGGAGGVHGNPALASGTAGPAGAAGTIGP